MRDKKWVSKFQNRVSKRHTDTPLTNNMYPIYFKQSNKTFTFIVFFLINILLHLTWTLKTLHFFLFAISLNGSRSPSGPHLHKVKKVQVYFRHQVQGIGLHDARQDDSRFCSRYVPFTLADFSWLTRLQCWRPSYRFRNKPALENATGPLPLPKLWIFFKNWELSEPFLKSFENFVCIIFFL